MYLVDFGILARLYPTEKGMKRCKYLYETVMQVRFEAGRYKL